MATTYTPLLGLPKHDISDPFDITLINDMADLTDAGMARAYQGADGNELFINGDFLDPVNQRGNTSLTANGAYIVDMWAIESGNSKATVSVGESGITLEPTADNYCGISQRFEKYEEMMGNAYTIGVCVAGAWSVASFTYGSIPSGGITLDNGLKVYGVSSNARILIRHQAGQAPIAIQRASLRKGTFTAANWAERQEKRKSEKLTDCQWLFRKVVNATGYVSQANAYIFIPYTMRITPTVTVKSIGSIRTQGGSYTPTGVSAVTMYADSIRLTMPGTYPEANHGAVLFGADIELSAEP